MITATYGRLCKYGHKALKRVLSEATIKSVLMVLCVIQPTPDWERRWEKEGKPDIFAVIVFVYISIIASVNKKS